MQNTAQKRMKRSTLYTIFFLSYFCSFGNPLIIPLFPQIMAHFQVSLLEMSLLVSLFALPGACIIPVLGILQDRFGRKPILLGALILCIAGSFGLAVSENFTVFLLCRAIQGLTVTPLEAVSNTLITDNCTGEERQRNIARNTSILFIGVGTFPLLSIAMLYMFGWRAALLLPCILGLPLLLLCLKLPMAYESSNFQWKSYLDNLKQLLASARLLSLFGVRMGLALVMFAAIHTYMPFLITDKLDGAEYLPGIFFALFSGALALGSISLGWRFVMRFSPLTTAMGGHLLFALSVLVLTLTPNVQLLAPALLLSGFGGGLLMTLLTVHIAQNTTQDTRATILSLSATAFRAAQAASPPLFGLFFALGGFSLLYGVATLASLLLLPLTRAAFRRH